LNEVWLSTIWYQLAINGNRGTQQELFVSIKVSKEIVTFQQEFPTECDEKMIQLDLRSRTKIRLWYWLHVS